MRLLIIAFLFLSFMASLAAEGFTGNFHFLIGVKEMDEDDWEPVEEHQEFGFKLDFKQEQWPVSIAIDILSSNDEGSAYEPSLDLYLEAELDTTELNIGVRKIWDTHETMRPFIGGGLAIIQADLEVTIPGFGSDDIDKTGVGLWLNGGVYWELKNNMTLGLDLRVSTADVDIDGYDADAGGAHAGFTIGYHW